MNSEQPPFDPNFLFQVAVVQNSSTLTSTGADYNDDDDDHEEDEDVGDEGEEEAKEGRI